MQKGDKAKCRSFCPSPPLFHSHSLPSLTCTLSFCLAPVLCVLWCFIWYPTIKPLFELPSIVYGFFLWGETESCLKGLQSRRLPSYWCRGVLPSSLLDQSLTSLLFYGWGHFTERSLTTPPQRFANRYSSDSRAGREGGGEGGAVERSKKHLGMILESVTVTYTCTRTYLSSTAVGASGLLHDVLKSNRKHWGNRGMLSRAWWDLGHLVDAVSLQGLPVQVFLLLNETEPHR